MGGISFTERELDVMAVLWELGSATVPEVKARLRDDLAYTTVQTVLRTLVTKGYVTHDEDGRFHRYRPLVEREEAGRSGLRRLVETVFRRIDGLHCRRVARCHPNSGASRRSDWGGSNAGDAEHRNGAGHVTRLLQR